MQLAKETEKGEIKADSGVLVCVWRVKLLKNKV